MYTSNVVVSDAAVEETANTFAIGSLIAAIALGIVALVSGKNQKILMSTAVSMVALAAALRRV